MLVSFNWIKDFVDVPSDLSPQELGKIVTLKTAEVEQVVSEAEKYDKMVVGKVTKLEKHPDADKLKIAHTDLGDETVQIVCGGANLEEGMIVAVAKVGAVVDWHGEGKIIEMKKVKIRGVESHGMICAGSEIGLDDPDAGPEDIMNLNHTDAAPGTPLSELFDKTDIVMEFDNKSLTHRPDLWGHYGIAREVAAIADKKLKKYEANPKIPEKGETIDVKVEDTDLCPRFCALVINNVKVEDSPDWLQKRLRAVGHGVHSNIVDITNYVMTELGQPMHAFDKELVKDGIVVRTAKKDEKLTTLDGKEHKLSEEMGVVANKNAAQSIAGIIGGKDSGISEKTTSIVLEAANWHASRLRRTSTKIGVRTDALQRFEKSLDPMMCPVAIKRAAELVLELCPEAEIAGPIVDIDHSDKKAITIDINLDKTRSKIGIEISDKDIKKILESLEFEVEEGGKGKFKVTVPSFRATKDVQIEDDLIEEVARMYGYDNIDPVLPSLPTKLPAENHERFQKHRARELFAHALGFDEVSNYSFYGKDVIEACNMDEEGHLKVLNYLSEDQTHMRTSMIPNLFKSIQTNIKNFDEFKIFEIGHTYKEIGQFMPHEEKYIAGAVVQKGKSDEVFYQAKGAIEALFKKFNLDLPKPVRDIENAPFAHPNKALTYIEKNGATLAKVFIVHPGVQKNHDLSDYCIALFEINFSEVMRLEKPEAKYSPIPKFPSTDFDVSILIDRTTEIGRIQSAIKQADQSLITNVELFDIYQGKGIDDDKKSVAFSITLQADDRTLTEAEINESQNKVFASIEKLGGEIRGK